MQIRAISSNIYMTVYSSVHFKLQLYHQMYYILIFLYDSIVLVGLGLLIVEVSRSHSDTPQSVGPLWTSDQPIAETTTWQHTTVWRDRHPMNLAGLELAIPESIRRQINASDRAAIGIGYYISYAHLRNLHTAPHTHTHTHTHTHKHTHIFFSSRR